MTRVLTASVTRPNPAIKTKCRLPARALGQKAAATHPVSMAMIDRRTTLPVVEEIFAGRKTGVSMANQAVRTIARRNCPSIG